MGLREICLCVLLRQRRELCIGTHLGLVSPGTVALAVGRAGIKAGGFA
jgi:hypothetical protein